MSKKRVFTLIAGALVAGLALGTMSSAWAATTATGTTNPVVAGACGLGLRLGTSVRDAGGRLADVVAKLTGLSATDVRQKRASGQSFTDIAKSKGVSSTAVVDEALKVRKTALDSQVKAGTITQAQEDAALATMKTRLQDRVSSTAPGCTGTGSGAGRGQGRGMGGGMGAGAVRGAGACGGTCGLTATAPTVQ